MLLALPGILIDLIYFAAAILPAAFLLRYIWRKDRLEKEPPRLLLSLLLAGVEAALVSLVLEKIGTVILNLISVRGGVAYTVVLAFIVVAAVEEGAKLFFLKRKTWGSTSFDYMFDGIVYSVFVSLGFAAFENISYVSSMGLSVVIPRAFLAVPGHMGFAVFMGIFYGRAKRCERVGDIAGRDGNLRRGFITAMLLHGFYDSCAMIGNVLSTLLFSAFVVIMYIVVIRIVKRESQNDGPI